MGYLILLGGGKKVKEFSWRDALRLYEEAFYRSSVRRE